MSRELIIASNPGRRKRRTSAKQRAAALRNLRKARAARRRPNPATLPAAANPPRRRKRRPPSLRRRRNPIKLRGRRIIPRNLVDRQLMPALIGGGGAVANDVAYNIVMNLIPAGLGGGLIDQLRAGPLRHAGKAVSALVLAWAASIVLPRRTADQLGAGALTVVGYNVVRDVVARVAPGVNMGMFLEPAELGVYTGAGWSPSGHINARYGSDFTQGSGLAMFQAPSGAAVEVGPQLAQPNYFAAPAYRSEGYAEESY